jgi:fructan beta-fructosidase
MKLVFTISILAAIICSCQIKETELLSDFNSENMDGWTTRGDMKVKPFNTELLPADVIGFEGAGVLNTGHDKVEKTGIYTSPEFIISKRFFNFLITGNNHYNAEYNCHVRIVINDKVVKYAPPTRYPLVEWGAMDVSEFIGQTARFEVFDKSEKHFIIIDQIFQSNKLALGSNQTSMTADKQYLLFPVTKGGRQYRFRLEKEDDVSEQFVVEMGEGEPDYWAFKDISKYEGKKLKLMSYCPTPVAGFDKIKQSNSIPEEELFYQENKRPQFHFTSKTGWINDPNGLVYNEGQWHLMYQHNPYGVIGSLKHWGHAVSSDLVHWQERPSSVVPDDLGSNHSGGAVVDFNNSAGLQTGKDKTLIAYWTSAGHFTTPSSHFRQCMSFSTDGGETWNKYAENPIIGFIEGRNRDPNVIWHEEANKWIMSLFVGHNMYAIFNSNNLIDWTLTDKIKMPANECPDMFQLNLDNNPEKRKWIFWGGNGNYVVGKFDGEKFDIEGEAQRTHFGNYYAAMTYNNAPDNRIIQLGWLTGWPFPETNFRMQLSISNELTLKTSPEGVPTLYSYPVKEMESLRTNSWSKNNISIGKQSYTPDFEAELIDLNVTVKVKKDGILKIKIRGEEIVYNRDENSLSYGNKKVNLLTKGDLHEFRILVDRASIEIFCNGGEKALFLPIAMDRENRKLEFSTNGSTAEIKQLDIYELKTSWEK